MKTNLGKVGLVGRFKPLHKQAAYMLESVCENANHLTIGIGSSNRYDARNPFTANESEDMINSFLSLNFSNYNIIHIPDFAQIKKYGDGQKWKEYVVENFGKLDYFISSNPYVLGLLKDSYSLLGAFEMVPPEKRQRMKGTGVRIEIAKFGDWEKFVPEPVAKYLKENNLIQRFRDEFGLETLGRIFDEFNLREFENSKSERESIAR